MSDAADSGDAALDTYDVSRDDLGSTRIDVSELATAYVYDEGDPDEVDVDLRPLDADTNRAARVALTATDAHRLREALAEALEARELERRRYDREAEPGE